MSGILSLFSGPVSTILGPVIQKIMDLIPDPVEKAKQLAAVQAAMLAADQQMEAQQSAIDLAEAQGDSFFKAGWRPFVGWTCASALGCQILIFPVVEWACAVFGYHPVLPPLDPGLITSYLVPMLGLGGYRTYEKVNNATNATTTPKAFAAGGGR